LGLVRDGYSWRLDTLAVRPVLWHSFSSLIFAQPARDFQGAILPRGEGNVVAVEFNVLYTWHATLSLQDAEWITNALKHMPTGDASDTVSGQ
jgi:linoleate 10R-lipoxygenase